MEEENYNRLFILGGKGCSEEEWRTAFEEFGNISHLQVVKDRRTGEDKGIVYITYSRISEAARAMEEMNGKYLHSHPKPLKVMIASSKRDGNVKDPREDEKMLRLFIMCDKSSTEEELATHFGEFGKLEYVRLLTDRVTKQPKGLAYVKYYRASHAAKAFEDCDQKYKAKFATVKPQHREQPSFNQYEDYGPPPPRRARHDPGPPSHGSGGGGGGGGFGSPDPMGMVQQQYGGGSSGETRLEAVVPAGCTNQQIYRLFDLVPGLKYCDLDQGSCVAYIKYSHPSCSSYAQEKLNNFEYPPGYRLTVRFPSDFKGPSGRFGEGDGVASSIADLNRGITNMSADGVDSNISTLVHTIQKATAVLEKAGLGGSISGGGGGGGGGGGASDTERVQWCNVPLPFKRELASRDSACEERLFLVSQPQSFPDSMLVNLLCRFGHLIDAYFMPGKNFGYAKFASLSAAEHAMSVLHGQTVCNARLKVMHAEPPKYDSSNRGGGGDDDKADGRRSNDRC